MDLSTLREIPGYKAILKSVLKSQIQLLLEQLSQNTGEESIILTASVDDGSLSHLGSNMGKGFLDGREEIKSQFLGFCLKGHHQKKSEGDRNQSFGHIDPMTPVSMPQFGKRPRIRPHPYAFSPSVSQNSPNHRTNVPPNVPTNVPDFTSSSPPFIKNEEGSSNSADNFIDSVSGNGQEDQMNFSLTGSQPHTQTSSQSGENNLNQSIEDGNQPDRLIKQEPGDDDDVTIVEQGDNSSSDQWGQGDPNELDQSGLSQEDGTKQDKQDKGGENLGGIAFPGLDNAHHDFRGLPDLSSTELKHVLYPEGGRSASTDNPILDMQMQSLQYSPYTSPVRSRMSTSKKPAQYWCNYCNKALQNKALYEYHVRAHNGVKPFECKLCHRKFAGKQVLETHMRLHSGEKPFKCSVPGCDRAFSARSGLNYHIQKHHPPDALS